MSMRSVLELLESIEVQKVCHIQLGQDEWKTLVGDEDTHFEKWDEHCSMKCLDACEYMFYLSNYSISKIRADIAPILADVCVVLKKQGFQFVRFYA